MGIQMLNLAVVFAGPAALLGIAGGVLANYRKTAGGFLLVAGFSIISFAWIFVLVEAAARGLYADYFFFLISISFLWWSLLILLGGLLAFPRIRELLKKSWDPLPRATRPGQNSP